MNKTDHLLAKYPIISEGPMLDSKSFRAMSCGVYVIAARRR